MSEAATWFAMYFTQVREILQQPGHHAGLDQLTTLMRDIRAQGKKIIFAGNGASAATASHCALDLTTHAGIRSICCHDAALLTCLANDYGFDQLFARALQYYADPGDLVVLISASGRSQNLLQAASYAVQHELSLATLTGFHGNNPLAEMGAVNLAVPSKAYNIIEGIHQLWLLAICDRLIGRTEYLPATM